MMDPKEIYNSLNDDDRRFVDNWTSSIIDNHYRDLPRWVNEEAFYEDISVELLNRAWIGWKRGDVEVYFDDILEISMASAHWINYSTNDPSSYRYNVEWMNDITFEDPDNEPDEEEKKKRSVDMCGLNSMSSFASVGEEFTKVKEFVDKNPYPSWYEMQKKLTLRQSAEYSRTNHDRCQFIYSCMTVDSVVKSSMKAIYQIGGSQALLQCYDIIRDHTGIACSSFMRSMMRCQLEKHFDSITNGELQM